MMATTLDRVDVPLDLRGKRVLDVAVAGTALVLLAPLLLVLWLAIRLSGGAGDAIFRQRRVGRDGASFVLYKFRTMYTGASDDTHRRYVRLLLADRAPATGRAGLYKLTDDPRITRIGALLRRTSLDELPQLVNVLRGEMSLVGPRPALPYETELFPPEYDERFRVPPGLTGLWQVSGRNRLTMRQGLDLDLEYVRRRTMRLDLSILLRTVPAVLHVGGAS
jgi:lipopolysaccharide/colanic/teichoic acid biosynthesis glycosyltransferase